MAASMDGQWYVTGNEGQWQVPGNDGGAWHNSAADGETWLNPGDGGPWLTSGNDGGPWLNPNQESAPWLNSGKEGGTFLDPEEDLNEPPLLEELGVDPALTLRRAVGVWHHDSAAILGLGGIGDPDLAGPATVALVVAAVALATGRANVVYLVSLAGLLLVWYLVGALGERPLALVDVASALGYCLQPVAALAATRLLPDPLGLSSSLPTFVAPLAAAFATLIGAFAASRALADAAHARSARALIGYPCLLLYLGLAFLAAF